MSMINSKVVHSIENYRADIEETKRSFGTADLFKFEDPGINTYTHGGFGSPTDFNLILVTGKTGIGKSLLTQNMIKAVVKAKKRFAYLVLEDSMGETMARLEQIIDEREFRQADKLVFTEEDTRDLYKIGDALDIMEYLFEDENCDVIVLDHLQFLFESIDRTGDLSLRDENSLQRFIMRKLNRITKLEKKTLICVSHVNKQNEESSDLLDMIVGSSALAQAATQIFYLSKLKTGEMTFQMIKSRYTKKENEPLYVEYDKNLRLKVATYMKEDVGTDIEGVLI